jgi:hypothetical protein
MLDLGEALSKAANSFPHGPETIAEYLGIQVEHTSLKGCDGWCINSEDKTIIRVNNDAPKTRQRFTLAHEIAHLLLGTSPDVSPVSTDQISQEEISANVLAAELLLPTEWLTKKLTSLPIQRSVIDDIAKEGQVSDMMLCRRLVMRAAAIGLRGAFCAGFYDGKLKWVFPQNACPQQRANEIAVSTYRKHPEPLAYTRGNGNFFAMIFDTPTNWATLFVQSLKS